MKTKQYIQIAFICFAAMIGLTFNSCKKDTPAPTPTPAPGTIAFHLHTNVDTAEVDTYGSTYALSSGRKITVNIAQLYLSGIQLVKLDGSTVDVPGVIVFKKQQNEVYTIGSVASGNYQTVKFNIGLDAPINAATPAASDSTLNQPSMWFGATAQPLGFTFVNFQGTIDTTTAGTGTLLYPYSYKIGTAANVGRVTMPVQNYTISPGQVTFVHMIIDYNKLFNGIQLNVNSNLTMNTNAANATPLGIQISHNIPAMFRYEY